MQGHSFKNPQNYSNNNSLQYSFAMKALAKIKIKKTARILDVCCGDGRIPSELADEASEGSVLGTDISEQMIAHATKTYADKKNLGFMVMDASKNIFLNQFDVITSFNGLHWVKDQAKALEGIARAAVPNADIILLLSHKKSLYHHVLDQICGQKKWANYFSNYLSPRVFFEKEEYNNLLLKTGLNLVSSEEEEMIYRFDNKEKFKSFLSASMAHVKQVPEEKREEFLNDYINEFSRQLMNTDHKEDGAFPVGFWCLIVNATKPQLKNLPAPETAIKQRIFSKS